MPRRLLMASLDSSVVLDPPGPGNNKAFGHCRLDFGNRSRTVHVLGRDGEVHMVPWER